MRIGILGGTFNPIHIGHVRLGIEVKEQLYLDEIHFVPSFHPPHKNPKGLLPFDIRCKLVKLSISNIQGFKLSTIEKKNKNAPSYTLYTIKSYKELYPYDEIFFIIGSKDFFLIPSWYQWKKLFKMCGFVIGGDEKEISEIDQFLKKYFPNLLFKNNQWIGNEIKIHFVTIPQLQISSSLIRKKLREKQLLTHLVPVPIEKEIYSLKEYFSIKDE